MEEDLDEIARGGQEGVPWLTRFYFGNGQPGLKRLVSDHLGEIDAREINSIPIGGPDSGLVVRVGSLRAVPAAGRRRRRRAGAGPGGSGPRRADRRPGPRSC